MNDLLQLRGDLSGRFEKAVHSRRSLRDMRIAVSQLTETLEDEANRIIRPESPYWAALSYSIAGVVEATEEILEEANSVQKQSWIVRWFVYFCNGTSFDEDVEEISQSFNHIEYAVLASDQQMNVQEKMCVFQTVGNFNSKPCLRRSSRTLSNIVEETETESNHNSDKELASINGHYTAYSTNSMTPLVT